MGWVPKIIDGKLVTLKEYKRDWGRRNNSGYRKRPKAHKTELFGPLPPCATLEQKCAWMRGRQRESPDHPLNKRLPWRKKQPPRERYDPLSSSLSPNHLFQLPRDFGNKFYQA